MTVPPGFIGQRIDENATPPGRLYDVPPAASTWLGDGRPLDAGTVHFLDNNAHHRSWECGRQLVSDGGVGTLLTQLDGWSGLSDGGAPPAGVAATDPSAISWSQQVARVWGPYWVAQDRPSGVTGIGLLRSIVFRVVVTDASGALILYYALTTSLTTPDSGFAAYDKSIGPATGLVSKTLLTTAPLPTGTALCRPPSLARGDYNAHPVPVYVWLGYHGGPADQVNAISVFEGRP